MIFDLRHWTVSSGLCNPGLNMGSIYSIESTRRKKTQYVLVFFSIISSRYNLYLDDIRQTKGLSWLSVICLYFLCGCIEQINYQYNINWTSYRYHDAYENWKNLVIVVMFKSIIFYSASYQELRVKIIWCQLFMTRNRL